jgi:hypothetical protein
LIGASVSASYGFRGVLVTAAVVLFNAIYSTLSRAASRGYRIR